MSETITETVDFLFLVFLTTFFWEAAAGAEAEMNEEAEDFVSDIEIATRSDRFLFSRTISQH